MLQKFACCVVASVFLWGCESFGDESELGDEDSEPIGEFLRTAAAGSQNSFNYPSAVNYYQNLYARDPDDVDAALGLARNLRYIGASGQPNGPRDYIAMANGGHGRLRRRFILAY